MTSKQRICSAACSLASATLLTVGLTCVLSGSVHGQEEDVISVETALVVLSATVTDRTGSPLSGLRRTQFTISEDGRPQNLEVFEAQESPFAAVILMDVSGSMQNRLALARSAAIVFLDGLRNGDTASIYTFASKVELLQDFSGSRDVTDRIFDTRSDGMTSLNDAIVTAAKSLSGREEKRRAIIVLSDGADTMSRATRETALRAAVDVGATIYTVDMSDETMSARERMLSRSALRDLADRSGGVFIQTPGGVALREAFSGIVRELGTQYTLGYQPADAKHDGRWRKIDVRVDVPGATVRARKGYSARSKR
jgi:Ca-activated chloride channel family protein